MATVFGNAGEGAVIQILKRVVPPAAALLAASPFFAWGIMAGIQRGYGLFAWIGTAAICASIIWLQRRTWREVIKGLREIKTWKKGADGEVLVHRVLAELPKEFAVFHDYHPVTRDGERAEWNVDHMVIGPTGVFVIETKNYMRTRVPPAKPGSLEAKNVSQVRGNAVELKKRLSLWSRHELDDVFVVPVLVYAQEGAFVEQKREKDVRVIPLKWLRSEITSHAEQHLDLDQAGRVVAGHYAQMGPEHRSAFAAEMQEYGAISKNTRYEKLDAANAARAAQEQAAAAAALVPTVCPLCGAALLKKPVKRGSRAGKWLLGCSTYPECKFVRNLD